jgi:zinc D-Ala-D-Ala dipeptidase
VIVKYNQFSFNECVAFGEDGRRLTHYLNKARRCIYAAAVAIALILVSALTVSAQNKYGLKVTTLNEYLASIKTNSEKELVDLQEVVPGLVLDIRYATTNNFTGEKIYNLAKVYARRPVAEALKKIQAELKLQGLGIKIFDAYRPYKATVKFYEIYKDTTYVASPYRGSRHNRGCALDLTVINLQTAEELKMPTGYDSFSKAAWPSTPVNDPLIRKNRALLINVMQKHGFRVNSSEWWHFDFIGWKKFEVLDIDFEELEK